MQKIRTCVYCGFDFDTRSYAKRKAGGKINECADCVEELDTETAVRYLGLQAGDGKTNALSIVAFETKEDRQSYSSAWKAVTGFHKGKSCQLGRNSTNIGGRPMRHVSHLGGNGNHKGKLD